MCRKYLIPIIFLLYIFFIGSCAITPEDPTDDITKYVGTWNVNDIEARINYKVSITSNPANSTEILLINFADLDSTAIGLVVGNFVVIDNQSLGYGYSVSGEGNYINASKLEFNFELDDGIDIESRVAVFTK